MPTNSSRWSRQGIAEQVKPGQFVALAVGGDHSSMLLRRAFSVYRTEDRGVYGGTVEIVFAEHGKGTSWMSRLRSHDVVDIVGPLGRPFALPKEEVTCALVGGGYGSAPLFTLAEQLTDAWLSRRLCPWRGNRGPPLRRTGSKENGSVSRDHYRRRFAW